ncbi:Hypothetical protein Minf_0594 [Methylacidiphilum infernorum V4]|uniref:Uncharacterized protein n=1 Tax=Methylacidiphilum infernorum (isolate V4) TaxID=481448 RepID=B3DZZ1_METI4|nr:hypothetical protein [Candidatus Methylacidiphilum infernorum]ACD82652.1 Hypothetical protein Minf_0594 [Methylacidiphilum infernorum V4]
MPSILGLPLWVFMEKMLPLQDTQKYLENSYFEASGGWWVPWLFSKKSLLENEDPGMERGNRKELSGKVRGQADASVGERPTRGRSPV